MLTYLQMSLNVIVALIFLNFVLSSALPMTLLISDEDGSVKDSYDIPVFIKRHVSGSDPWSLCPDTMERVDCFYEYLRVYARLRKAVQQSNSVSVRNIGKRSDYMTAQNIDHTQKEQVPLSLAYSIFDLLDELDRCHEILERNRILQSS